MMINSPTLTYILILLLSLTMHSVSAASDSLNNDEERPMFVLNISTVDEVEPTCDYVFPPEGAFGISITNAVKVPGRAVITVGTDTLFDTGTYEKGTSGMTIKIRGNTSAYYYEKKPFKIKLQKKADMLVRGDSRYADKDWALICDGDNTFNTMIGLKVAQLMDLGWVPAYHYVHLFMNGNYRGIYMLIETVERNADCRIDVDKNTGYIIERDAYWWNEDIFFRTPMKKEYTFKYPDSDDLKPEQLTYIQSAVEAMEESISNGTYRNTIDVKSFARWLLAHEILGTRDSGGANIYLKKADNTAATKFTMCTLWDFGSIMKMDNDWAGVHNDFFYFTELFSDPDSYFTWQFKKLWTTEALRVFDAIEQYLYQFKQSNLAYYLNTARKYDQMRWNYTYDNTVENDIDQAIAWFKNRKTWLQQAMDTLTVSTGINNMPQTETYTNCTYDLQGRQVHSRQKMQRGLYIRDGKKMVNP